MRKNAAGNYVIDIRDQRLRGGRLTLSTRTGKAPEARRREAAVRALLDMGHHEIIERLRDRSDPLRIEELTRAKEEGTLDRLVTAYGGLQLGAAADRFLQRVEAELASETHRQYEMILRFARNEFGDDRDPATITPGEWRDWLTAPKETTGNEPWSQNRQTLAYACLNRFYGELVEEEDHEAHAQGRTPRITRNPFTRIERQWERTRVEFLRQPEWQKLYETVEGTPLAAFFALGCLAGLRIGEAANLRMGIDLILEDEKPRIEIQPREGEYAWSPKGYPRHDHSVRTIPLRTFPTLLEILRRHVADGYAGERYFIVVPGYDRPPSRQHLARQTKEGFEAAGIRYGRKKDALTYHSLRHTYISWLVQEDYSLAKISKLAGTSVRMILEVYGHLVDEDLERGMELLEERFTREEEE